MNVGDRVLFVSERGSEPQPGTVAARLSIWVDVDLDNGQRVEQVFAAANHFQSPRGNYCVLTNEASTREYPHSQRI